MADYKMPDEFYYDGILWGPPTCAEMLDKVKALTLSQEDVVISTYPKSGTTWMKYIVALIYHGLENADDLSNLISFLEFVPRGTPDEVFERLTAKPPPRIFTSHLGAPHLHKQVHEDKVKMIVVMRNPKDTLVSFYHFYRMNKYFGKHTGTFNEWFELVKARRLWAGDIFDYNAQWWEIRDKENVLIMFYEEMKKDPCKAIHQVAQFCGKSLPDDVISAMAEKSSFSSMKSNDKTNAEFLNKAGIFDFKVSPFLRKGEAGDWKNYFNYEQNEYIDKRCKEEWDPVGLKFIYEL